MWKSRFILQQIVKRDMFYIDNYVHFIHIQSYYSIMYIFISITSSIKSMNRKKDWKKISQNFNSNNLSILPFPGGSNNKQFSCNSGDLSSVPGLEDLPWTREWQPTPIFLPGESHGQRSLVDYSPWGLKESDMTERLTHTPIYSSGEELKHREIKQPAQGCGGRTGVTAGTLALLGSLICKLGFFL